MPTPELLKTLEALEIVNPNWEATAPKSAEKYAHLLLVLSQFGCTDLENPGEFLKKNMAIQPPNYPKNINMFKAKEKVKLLDNKGFTILSVINFTIC